MTGRQEREKDTERERERMKNMYNRHVKKKRAYPIFCTVRTSVCNLCQSKRERRDTETERERNREKREKEAISDLQ